MRLELSAPHTVYKDSKGNRLTGVTTYLGVLAKPQLLGWYASMEREGVQAALRSGRPLPSKKDGKPLWYAEAKRDKAADLGTIVHFRAEAWLKGEHAEAQGIPPDLWSASQHGLDRFIGWWEGEGLELIESEKVLIYESPEMSYGGTADILARDGNGRKVLVDLKTSKASPYWPYDEVYGQVAAYAIAEKSVDRIVVARIGKEPNDELQAVEVTERQEEAGLELFMAAYLAYEAKKALERLRK
jgi:hypothetical protein